MSLYVSHVSSGSGWTNEVILRDGPQLPLNAWSTITVTVDSVGLQLTLTAVTTSTGDTIIPLQSVSFATPQQLTWSNVQVYASDPWYTVADAKIRNLLIDVGIYTPQRLAAPTDAPSVAPTAAPSAAPTRSPSASPTLAPTAAPTLAPIAAPTLAPIAAPTLAPVEAPTAASASTPTTIVAPPTGAASPATVFPTPGTTTAGTGAGAGSPVIFYSGTATSFLVTKYYNNGYRCSGAADFISASYAGYCSYNSAISPYGRKTELSAQGNLAYRTSSSYSTTDCTGATTSTSTSQVKISSSTPMVLNNCSKSSVNNPFSINSITYLPPLSGLVQASYSGADCTGVVTGAQNSPMGYCIIQGSNSWRNSCFNTTHTVSEWWSTSDCTTSANGYYNSGFQRMTQPDGTNTSMTIGTCFSISYGMGNTQYIKATSCNMPIAVDGQALCDFYNALTAGQSALTNWCPGSAPYDPCVTGASAWTGVTCGTVNGATRVTGLGISNLGLEGSVPKTIGYLDALTSLNVDGNSGLTGFNV